MVAHGQAESRALAMAREALAEADTSAALEALGRVAKADTAAYAEAQYERARLLLTAAPPDVGRAKAALRRALRLRPEDPRYLALDLVRFERFPPKLLPIIQTERLMMRARALLALDSTSADAHRVMGRVALDDFADRADRADVWLGPDDGRGGTMRQREAARAAAELHLDASGADRVSGLEFPVTRNEEAAAKNLVRAREHLYASLRARAEQPEVFRMLTRVFLRTRDYAEADRVLQHMRGPLGHTAEYWLYLGAVQHRAGRADAAALSFDRGLRLLNDADRHAFEDLTAFLTDAERADYVADPGGFATEFWERRDPRLLTQTNERRLEHYTRLVYADLRFGDPAATFGGEPGRRRGWDTDPGRVVVRYGEPLREYQRSGMFDEVAGFDYGDIGFKFMRLGRVGRWTFYSPPAASTGDVRNVGALWDGDFALKAPEWFRDIPERYDYRSARPQTDVPHLASAFRGEGGRAEIVVAMELPREAAEAGVTLAAFLLGEANERAAQAHRVTPPAANATSAALVLHAAPGAYTLAAEYDANRLDAPLGASRSEITVPDLAAPGLALSDVLLLAAVEDAEPGERAEAGWIQRAGLALAPASSDAFASGGVLPFYFEVYGLSLRDGTARYRVEAALLAEDGRASWRERLAELFGGGGERGVSVAFDGQTSATRDARYFLLDLAGLDLGAHRLALRVTDIDTGEMREVSRAITITEPTSSATAATQ